MKCSTILVATLLSCAAICQTADETETIVLDGGFKVKIPAQTAYYEVPKETAERTKWQSYRDANDCYYGMQTKFFGKMRPGEEDYLLSQIADSEGDTYVTLASAKETLYRGWAELDLEGKSRYGGRMLVERFFIFGHYAVGLSGWFPTKDGTRPASITAFLNSIQVPATLGKGHLASFGPKFKRYPIGNSGMSAEFPSKPKVDQTSIDPSDENWPPHLMTSEYHGRAFKVDYKDLAKSPSNEAEKVEILEAELKRVRKLESASFLDETTSDWNGDTARLWTCEVPRAGGMLILSFIHGSRLVTLRALIPTEQMHGQEAQNFLHSLKFTPN